MKIISCWSQSTIYFSDHYAFNELYQNLGYVFVAVLGGVKVANGMMDLGDVQAFLQYTNQFSQPITQIANLMNTIKLRWLRQNVSLKY